LGNKVGLLQTLFERGKLKNKAKRRYYEKAPKRQLTVKPEGVTVG
jgi:hypothetical protein